MSSKQINQRQRNVHPTPTKSTGSPKNFRGIPSASRSTTERDGHMNATKQKLGGGQKGSGKNSLLNDRGNERPKSGAPKRYITASIVRSGAPKSSTSAEGKATHSQKENEMLRQIRDKLREACEREKTGTRIGPKDSKTLEDYLKEIDTYANTLINHLDSKSDKSIKAEQQVDKKQERTMTEEANQTIDKINGWLSKLEDQIQKDEFDVKDFKFTTKGKGNKTKTLIEDICTKLNNKKAEMIKEVDTEKKKLDNAIEQLENEIRRTERQGKSANKKMNGQKTSLSRLNDCTESVKTEREAALSQAKLIYDPLLAWRSKLSKGKKAPLKTKPTNMSEETDIVAVLKEISVFQSELLNKKNVEDSATSKNLQEIKEQIRKMWGNVMKESEPPGISAALLTLENHITENQAKLEKLLESKQKYKAEIDCLHGYLKRFDGIVTDDAIKTDKKGDDVMQAILLFRKKLNERIKEIKEDRQNGATNKKKARAQLYQSLNKLWKTAMNDEGKDDVRDDGDEGQERVLQKIEAVTSLFDRVEKVAFKLEETCYGIYETVKGIKPATADTTDDKTSIQILETTLRKSEEQGAGVEKVETKTEVLEFGANLDQLVNVLSLKRKEKSISGTCKLITETIERFRLKYKELQQGLDDSKERERIITTEKENLLLRLSKVASANLTDNNPNIADLSDQNRPTKLAEQFSELYDTPWTDAFDEFKHLDEPKTITFLLEILVETYKSCKEISINHQKILMRALQIPTDSMEVVKTPKTKENVNDFKLSAVNSKLLSDLKKQTADLSLKDVTRYLTTKHKEWFKTKLVGTYASECIKLCWLMNIQSPPVYMVTDVKVGSKFDTEQYKYYTKTGKKVGFLVWPVLFLHEGGPLLCKGVAQGK